MNQICSVIPLIPKIALVFYVPGLLSQQYPKIRKSFEPSVKRWPKV